MATEHQMIETIDSLCSVFNRGNADRIDELVGKDFLYTTTTSRVQGLRPFADYLRLIQTELQGLQFSVTDMQREGNVMTGSYRASVLAMDSSRLSVKSGSPVIVRGRVKAVFDPATGKLNALNLDYTYADLIRQTQPELI